MDWFLLYLASDIPLSTESVWTVGHILNYMSDAW